MVDEERKRNKTSYGTSIPYASGTRYKEKQETGLGEGYKDKERGCEACN